MLQAARSFLASRRASLGALQNVQYRRYWFATLIAVMGFQMSMFSQAWLVRQLEENPIWLGMVGLAQGVPAIVFNLVGGVMADRVEQRRLIIITQGLTGAMLLVLAMLVTFGVVRVWHILAIAFASGILRAFDQPARQALFPRLIDRKDMMSAVALNSSIWQGTRIIAPASSSPSSPRTFPSTWRAPGSSRWCSSSPGCRCRPSSSVPGPPPWRSCSPAPWPLEPTCP